LEYTFKHTLTHDVAYAGLLQERRRALHARIVAAVEALYPDRLAEQVERLADHAFPGEGWDKAVAYLRHAGGKGGAAGAYPEGVTCFEQALVALERLPESRETRSQAVDLRVDLPRLLIHFGDHNRSLDYLREAEALAEALDDPGRLGQVAVAMASHYWATGDHDRATES